MVDLAIKNGGSFHCYVKLLPEGMYSYISHDEPMISHAYPSE